MKIKYYVSEHDPLPDFYSIKINVEVDGKIYDWYPCKGFDDRSDAYLFLNHTVNIDPECFNKQKIADFISKNKLIPIN